MVHIESRRKIYRLFDAQLVQSAQVLLEQSVMSCMNVLNMVKTKFLFPMNMSRNWIFRFGVKATLLRSTTALTTAMAGDKEGYSETIELTLEEGSASTMQGMAIG